MISRGEWRAVRIHLPYSAQTGYLCSVIGPLLRDIGYHERFFFLRYWQGGPHIRLRIHGAPEDVVDSVRGSLASAVPQPIAELAREYGNEVSFQAELAELEGEPLEEISPLGAVEPATYMPEYGKYGGAEGVEIAERLFCATSLAVLDLLSAQGAQTPRAPIGEAIRATAMALRGSGLDIAQSREFLERYENYWRRYVQPGQDAMWPGLYDKTGASVRGLCRSVWQENRTDTFYDIYANALTAARALPGLAAGDRGLAHLTLAETTYAGCVANYIHTTNNRLGVIPASEALVAYVLNCALTELATA